MPIKKLEPTKYPGKTAGEISLINFINSHPKKKVIVELKTLHNPHTDIHDPNFNKTIESLTTIYV